STHGTGRSSTSTARSLRCAARRTRSRAAASATSTSPTTRSPTCASRAPNDSSASRPVRRTPPSSRRSRGSRRSTARPPAAACSPPTALLSTSGGSPRAEVAFADVDKIYDNVFHAVHDLSLEIEDGEFLVLVGPSGCGKTTALRMVAGLEDISRGVLKIGERVVNHV